MTKNDECGVVISIFSGGRASTIFHYPGSYARFKQIEILHEPIEAFPNKSVNEAASLVASNLGLPDFIVVVKVKGKRKYLQHCNKLSEADHKAIALLLMSFNETF